MKILAGGIFLVIMFAVFGSIASVFSGDSAILIRYALVALLSFLAVLVHELGHAATVLAVGGRITSIAVMPFSYHMASRKFALRAPVTNSEIGGYVAYEIDRIGARQKHAWVAVAGPVANLTLSGLMAALMTIMRQEPFVALAGALAILSFGMGIVNLIPFQGSDGEALLRSWRQGRANRFR